MSQTRVTVLMPVYNGERYLRETIESVLAQTYEDFEFLIINDGSTDSTKDIVSSFYDMRIHYVENDFNLGLVATLNKGIEMVDTEFLARMDADDLWDETKLEKQIAIMDSHPEIGLCGTSIRKFGTINNTMFFPIDNEGLKVGFLFYCMMSHPSVVYRTSLLHESGLRYRKDAFPAEDYKMWVDMLDITQIHNIPEPLVLYRQHEEQICREKKDIQLTKTNEVKTELLKRIYPSISSEEILYHNNVFSNLSITTNEDFLQFRKWTKKLIKENSKSAYVNRSKMRKYLGHYVDNAIYIYLHERYFGQNKRPLRYLMSGDWRYLTLKRQLKMFIR